MFLSIDYQRNGLETHAIKLHNIRYAFYLEPCNFTLNPFQDFVLTSFKPEQKYKITVECLYNTYFIVTQMAIYNFCNQKERLHEMKCRF